MLLMLALAIVNLISECNVKDCSLWSIAQTRVNEAWVILVTCFLVCVMIWWAKLNEMMQNMEVLLKMGTFTGITSELAIPSDPSNYVPIQKRPPITEQVIIGTPGTISKWITARKLGMSQMKILVFDEADHMLAEVIYGI